MTAKRDLNRWAWDRVPALGLSASELHVLRALVWRFDETRQFASPSLTELVGFTRLSETTVLRSLKSLEEQRLVRREARTDSDGGKVRNRYRFAPQGLPPLQHRLTASWNADPRPAGSAAGASLTRRRSASRSSIHTAGRR